MTLSTCMLQAPADPFADPFAAPAKATATPAAPAPAAVRSSGALAEDLFSSAPPAGPMLGAGMQVSGQGS
jgi:hypothetical protein